jgi:cysteine-rich repeat protein
MGCSADVDDVFDNTGGAGGTGGGGAGTPTTTGMSTSSSSPTSTTSTSSSPTSTTSTSSSPTTSVTTGQTTAVSTGMPFCGNSVIEAGEDCDGPDLGGHDCTELGYVNPIGAFCTENCLVEYGFCEPECGNGVIEPDETCDDGNLVNGDGCSATCEPDSDPCGSVVPVMLALGTTTLMGSTFGSDMLQPQQSNGCSNGTGPEVVYEITPLSGGVLTAWLPSSGADFDSMLYFRNECDQQASQTLCNDNFNTPGNAGGEVVSSRIVANQPIYLVVDGWGGEQGDFELQLDLSTGEDCNDPVPITLEGSVDIRSIGSTLDHVSDAQCLSTAGFGADVVYQITTTEFGDYTFANTAGYNSVMNARSSCGDIATELGCANPTMTQNSQLTFNDLSAGTTVFLWIDGTMGEAGTYSLQLNQ